MNAENAAVGVRARVSRRTRGFSLAELLVTMAVAAVLLVVAVPHLGGILEGGRVEFSGNSFLGPLYLARSEAIKRNTRVVLCRSSTGNSCAASGGWEQGYIVFIDSNNNVQVDAGETIVLRREALPSSLRFKGNAGVAGYVSYVGTGATQQASGAFQAGTFTLCSLRATTARQIIISSSGRPRIQKIIEKNCA